MKRTTGADATTRSIVPRISVLSHRIGCARERVNGVVVEGAKDLEVGRLLARSAYFIVSISDSEVNITVADRLSMRSVAPIRAVEAQTRS